MNLGERDLALCDVDSTLNNVSDNTKRSRESAQKSITNFLKKLPDFGQNTETMPEELALLITTYGGCSFLEVFTKTHSTGLSQREAIAIAEREEASYSVPLCITN